MALAEQRDLLFEVKRRLKDPESHDDAMDLLRMLRDREELLASVAEEIDTIVDRSPQERHLEPSEDPTLAEGDSVAGLPPATIDLAGDSKGIEALVRNVAANSESWILKAGEDSLCIYLENGELVLSASFHRWTEKDAKSMKGMGWSQAGRGVQGAAAAALGVLGVATYGLGFGLLMHKGTRDYLTRNLSVKRFSLSQEREVVMNIVEAFRVLCPDILRVEASRAEALPDNPTGG